VAAGDATKNDDPFQGYVKSRGLSPVALRGIPLHEYTPMMSIGPSGLRADGATGSFLDGIPATLLHSTYGAPGQEPRDFTLIVATISEAVAFARNLSCRERKVQRDLAHTELARFGDSREVRLESTAFDERFALQAPPGIDANWLRQLFTPALIDWLATNAPDGFCFELNEGHFCAAIPGHATDPAVLDAFVGAASQAARRSREEAVEGAGHAEEAASAAPDEHFQRLLGRVAFNEPPPDVAHAAERYMGVAMRRPGNFLRAVGASFRHRASLVALALILLAIIVLGAGGADSIGVGANVLAWVIPAALAAGLVFWLNLRRQAKELANRLGEEAFVRSYAASRNLRVGDPAAFQVEHARLRLPGAVRHVMVGTLPGTQLDGAIALVDAGVQKDVRLSSSATESMQSGWMGLLGMGADDNRTYDAVVFDSSAASPSAQATAPAIPTIPSSMGAAFQMWQGMSQRVLQDAQSTRMQ